MKILETKHLKKYYGQGSSLVKAVDDISISVEKGEFVAIVGTSGSGKTSLLNLLGGLDYADCGEVIIGGQQQRMRQILCLAGLEIQQLIFAAGFPEVSGRLRWQYFLWRQCWEPTG